MTSLWALFIGPGANRIMIALLGRNSSSARRQCMTSLQMLFIGPGALTNGSAKFALLLVPLSSLFLSLAFNALAPKFSFALGPSPVPTNTPPTKCAGVAIVDFFLQQSTLTVHMHACHCACPLALMNFCTHVIRMCGRWVFSFITFTLLYMCAHARVALR